MTESNPYEKIVETASGLFFSQGSKRVTMDQVAQELHMSKRTLYTYFETKEELLSACLDRMADERKNHLMELISEASSPAFVLLQVFSEISKNNREFSLLLNDTKQAYPEIFNKYFVFNEEKCREGIHACLTLAQRGGDLRPNVDIDKAAVVLRFFITQMTAAPNTTDKLEILCESGYTFVRGLLSIDAIKRYDQQEKTLKDIIK